MTFEENVKRTMIAGLAAAVLGLTVGAAVLAPLRAEAKVQYDVFDFEAHRGGRDARPENTLYAYAYAMEMGAATIECDMQLTADNKIVMSHNPILNHEVTQDKNGKYIENGKYDIRTMTADQVKQFNVGHIDPDTEYYKLHGLTQIGHDAEIPTLDEVFQLIKSYGDKNIVLNIETKSYPDPANPGYANNPDPARFVRVFNDTVKKYGMEDRVVLQSFDWRTLVEMKKLNPRISTSALWQASTSWEKYGDQNSPWLSGLDIKDFRYDPVKAAKAIGVDFISPYYTDISKGDVAEAHKLGMKVVPWTVNNPEDMDMLLDMGVDGIITDKPWVLKAILKKRGIAMHAPVVNPDSPYHTGTDHRDVKTEKVKDGRDAAY